MRHILVRIRTEKNPDCGIVAIWTNQIIIHFDIHIHLPNILITQLIGFQVNQNKTTKMIIIEHKIYVVAP